MVPHSVSPEETQGKKRKSPRDKGPLTHLRSKVPSRECPIPKKKGFKGGPTPLGLKAPRMELDGNPLKALEKEAQI